VTGSREPLSLALLRGLLQSTKPLSGRKATNFRRKIECLYTNVKSGQLPTTTELSALFGECLDSVCDGKNAPVGLLLVVDELGKLLEHATTHADESDLYVLQSLAEFAARSSRPFLIIGVLHQDFSLYAQQLSPRERAEWDKVRGRFEDIAFEEPAEEILRLIAQARVQARNARGEATLDDASPEVRAAFASLCDDIWKLELAPAGLTRGKFVALLHQCWPLHPLVTVLLGPLFRRLPKTRDLCFRSCIPPSRAAWLNIFATATLPHQHPSQSNICTIISYRRLAMGSISTLVENGGQKLKRFWIECQVPRRSMSRSSRRLGFSERLDNGNNCGPHRKC
jgi:hypothetical protein